MTPTPSEQAIVLWRKAESDLFPAKTLLSTGRVFDYVCFQAQQAAEKSLKALLAYHGVTFPKTHHQALLILLIRENPTNFVVDDQLLHKLMPYAVEGRHEDIDPTFEDATEALSTEDPHSRIGLVVNS